MDNNLPETWMDKRFDIPRELLNKGFLLDNFACTILIPIGCGCVGVGNMMRGLPFFYKPHYHAVTAAAMYLFGQFRKANNDAKLAVKHSSMMKYARAHPELFPRENSKWGAQLQAWHPIR